MDNLMIVEHNCETGEIVERELTAAELKQAEKDKLQHQAELAKIDALAFEKAALLERLGITAEEAKLLLN
jgi:hypothetical protein